MLVNRYRQYIVSVLHDEWRDEMVTLREYHRATHCAACGEEAPLNSDGLCDFCSIESSEEEHEANNAELDARDVA